MSIIFSNTTGLNHRVIILIISSSHWWNVYLLSRPQKKEQKRIQAML